MNEQITFCFCTLALGDKYCKFATLLLEDLSKYAPHVNLVILTNNPKKFESYSNAIPFFHSQKSVGAYHDKRYVLEKALELFESCIFVDADVRILSSVPNQLEWLESSGIHARSCFKFSRHYAKVFSEAKSEFIKEFDVIFHAARKIKLDLFNKDIYFVKEWLFSVTKDSGKEKEFLEWWNKLEKYFELRGIYRSEGAVMGLAAAKAGFEIRHCEMDNLAFFKHHVTQYSVQKGQINPEDVAEYFEQYRKIKYPERSIFKRGIDKMSQTSSHFYRSINLQLLALSNIDFYWL